MTDFENHFSQLSDEDLLSAARWQGVFPDDKQAYLAKAAETKKRISAGRFTKEQARIWSNLEWEMDPGDLKDSGMCVKEIVVQTLNTRSKDVKDMWVFIEDFHPKYFHSRDVAMSNDLQKFVDGEADPSLMKDLKQYCGVVTKEHALRNINDFSNKLLIETKAAITTVRFKNTGQTMQEKRAQYKQNWDRASEYVKAGRTICVSDLIGQAEDIFVNNLNNRKKKKNSGYSM